MMFSRVIPKRIFTIVAGGKGTETMGNGINFICTVFKTPGLALNSYGRVLFVLPAQVLVTCCRYRTLTP